MAILSVYLGKEKNGIPLELEQKKEITMEVTVKDKPLKAYMENMKRETKYRVLITKEK